MKRSFEQLDQATARRGCVGSRVAHLACHGFGTALNLQGAMGQRLLRQPAFSCGQAAFEPAWYVAQVAPKGFQSGCSNPRSSSLASSTWGCR